MVSVGNGIWVFLSPLLNIFHDFKNLQNIGASVKTSNLSNINSKICQKIHFSFHLKWSKRNKDTSLCQKGGCIKSLLYVCVFFFHLERGKGINHSVFLKRDACHHTSMSCELPPKMKVLIWTSQRCLV